MMLITNATVVTYEVPNRITPNHAVYLSGDQIQEVGPTSRLQQKYPKSRTIDAHDQFLLPGGICAHTRFHRAFGRGLVVPHAAPKDLPEILERFWWPLERSLLQEDVRYCALLSLVDAIRHGTTTLFDHHSSPQAVDGSLDVIAEAVEASGLRAVLCYEVTDREGASVADSSIKENVRFLRRQPAGTETRIAAMFGLDAGMRLSGATLQACKAAAPDETGFQVITAEHESDQYDSVHKTGMRVVDRLHNHGILGPRTVAAHCVHVDALETRLLAETRTWVAHSPRSNMNTAVGAAPVDSLMRAGVRVCLGTDGLSHGMWDEWKAAYSLHKASGRDPRHLSSNQVAQMAIQNNAALASMYFHATPVGRISPGAAADLILVDYQPPTPLTADNMEDHVVFGFHSGMVTTTIAGGKVLMKDRQILTLDEVGIAARARELAKRVWGRVEDNLRR